MGERKEGQKKGEQSWCLPRGPCSGSMWCEHRSQEEVREGDALLTGWHPERKQRESGHCGRQPFCWARELPFVSWEVKCGKNKDSLKCSAGFVSKKHVDVVLRDMV